jgi:4a-hydroxytetrahydrobiopterin dehydratase
MSSFSGKHCKPCEGGVTPLSKQQSEGYLKELKDWALSADAKSIRAEYFMKDFVCAIDFVNQIAALAEKEGHHPDIHLTGYRKLVIELSTHAIGGLSENDFILAEAIDRLPKSLKAKF